MLLTQWRGIFIVLMGYGIVTLIWSALRMPETLPEERRRSLAIGEVLDAFRQTVTNRQTLGYALTAGGVVGSLFAFVFTSQQVFTEIYKLGPYFPVAFAAVAIGTAIAGFINSRFVDRLGMRVISHGALLGYVAVSGIMLAAAKLQMLPLPLFMFLSALMMFAFGLMISNFTALAMEPQGRIAGTASSLYGSITTLLGIGIGTKMGQDYDGTLLPFATGFFLCTLASLRADGTIHQVPVGATYDAELHLVRVITSGSSYKARNLRAHPGSRVSLAQVEGRWWCTVEGRATVSDEPERVAEAVRRYAERYRQPRPNPERVVIEIEVARLLGNVRAS